MSHEVNDKLHDAIIDEIVDGLDNLEKMMSSFCNKEFDNRSQ